MDLVGPQLNKRYTLMFIRKSEDLVTNVTFVPNASSKRVESQKKCHILDHSGK